MSRSPKQRVTLLIDADVTAYIAANVEQRVTDWGDGVVSVVMGTVAKGVQVVLDEAAGFMERLKADHFILCLTSQGDQFRKALLPSYKGNRGPKPLLVDDIRNELVQRHGGYRRPQLEGDDVMGILATHPTLIPGKKIIVSVDKDMQQIPGWLYNPGKNVLRKVGVREADAFFYSQIITGDATDNYKGIPGVGPVGAAKMLAGVAPRNRWKAIVQGYRAAGLTEADALVQARCARILRYTDYDFNLKRPILWTPPA